MNYLENDGIAVHSYEDACALAKILLDNGNAVMITEEEELYIVNYVWCDIGYPNRNDVVFRNRASVECEMYKGKSDERDD
jgi:hypothetical protein